MSATTELESGKGHRNENFPVASWLVSRRHRPAIMAFYRFARAADDVADHPTLPPDEKHKRLDAFEASLFGEAHAAEAIPLQKTLTQRRLSTRHPCDLLAAFRLDVDKRRYRSFDELMDYCALSAMPVGRFVLDVHGESHTTWEASDALCAALQIINHLQDCGKDYQALDRVYLPLDILEAHGASIEDLGRPAATPALKAAIGDLAERTQGLLARSAVFARQISDKRLRMEVAAIQRLAERLAERLVTADPLSERVHMGKPSMLLTTARAAMGEARIFWQRPKGKSRRRRA